MVRTVKTAVRIRETICESARDLAELPVVGATVELLSADGATVLRLADSVIKVLSVNSVEHSRIKQVFACVTITLQT